MELFTRKSFSVKLTNWWRAIFATATNNELFHISSDKMRRPVNVIIPVYRGVHETRRCLESVIAAGLPKNSFITVINDASPESAMAPLLNDFSNNASVTVLHNPVNRGFVGSVNRGMVFRSDADVVLLNSDTEVPVGWLERLQECAYASANIGTATPFSNNATICSYPRFCMDNSLATEHTVASLDALFNDANAGTVIDIPTAVGFCMYIRRACLNETGLFDEERFGRGYGEENDFCLRATGKGWRHVLCANLFVYHAGSVSFASERDERSKNAFKLIVERYPEYPLLIRRHIEKDPAREVRQRVDLLRLMHSKKQVILLISHRFGGGVLKHEQELPVLFRDHVNFLRLTPGVDGQIEISWFGEGESLRLYFSLSQDNDEFLTYLKHIRVARIHFHHVLDIPDAIKALPSALGVPYDFTVHDYYSICPKITLTNHSVYCGEPTEVGCTYCLKNSPKYQRDIRGWRAQHETLLANAERVLVPSKDVGQRLKRYFRLPNVIFVPHADLLHTRIPTPSAPPYSSGERLRIVVLGALSAIKGAEVLDAAALDAESRSLPIEYHLIGFAFRNLKAASANRLTVWGAYRDEDLLGLLKEARPHVIWFPAVGPETYSYTLSAALVSGLPIIAPDLGAFPERLASRPWSWICSWKHSPEEWNNLFIDLRGKYFVTNIPPPVPVKTSQISSFDWMSDYLKFDNARHNATKGDDAILCYADTHSRPTLCMKRQVIIAIRRGLLTTALRIRSISAFSILIDLMPVAWQHRIRYWLRK